MPASAFLFRTTAAIALALAAGQASATALQDLPRGARPGECYTRATHAPTYRTDHIPVAQPPRVSWREVPAVYKTVNRQVLATPGRVDHETIPEVTGTRIRWIEHAGPDRTVDTAPIYRWVEKRVLVAPAHLVWKPGQSAQGYGPGYGEGVSVRPTGEVMCRVLVPARYEFRRVRVLITPGKTCIVKGPSTRERVVEHFVVTPARIIDHPVAPTYRTVSEQVLVTPARKERVETPQPPRYVDKRVEVSPGKTEWVRIACKAPKPAYHAQPAALYGAPLMPHPHAGQCRRHVVCDDAPAAPETPYALPRPGGYGEPAPSYRAPNSGGGYGGARSD